MTAPITLAALDQRSVAAHIVFRGREELLRGLGCYENDPDLGAVLKIVVDDPAGDFELMVIENQWTGSISPGHAIGCDYLVRLS